MQKSERPNQGQRKDPSAHGRSIPNAQFLNIAYPKLTITKLFLFFLVVSMVGCNGQKNRLIVPEIEVLKTDLLLHPEEGKWYQNGQPFGGYAVVYHPNGILAEKVGFYQGKKEGSAKKWYLNGLLRYQVSHRANRMDGTAYAWTSEGVLVKESHYVMGKTHGVQKAWYPNGKLFKEMRFVMGKEEGIQKAWRENGAVFINYEAKNGRFFGLKRANACYELKEEIIQF